jgi:hypothetical protein
MMIVFKGGIQGGHLSVPEYGLRFKLPNNSLFMFDGQGLLHGVTPIKMESPASYRYSIVYYTLKRMWQCLEVNEELIRIRKKRALMEEARMENPISEEAKKRKAEARSKITARDWGI